MQDALGASGIHSAHHQEAAMDSESARVKGALLAELGRREEELIELCREIVRIPSENPPGDTAAIASFVESYLTRSGVEVARYAPQPDRPNLLALLCTG